MNLAEISTYRNGWIWRKGLRLVNAGKLVSIRRDCHTWRWIVLTRKIEGELSTDESDSDSEKNAAYQSTRDLLLRTAEEIFSDASEEYSQLSVVKERFETWKKEYFASYRDAYMSLSAPAIFLLM
ncbi:hypothetical protein NC653_019799 [Populus alba x Populus x berolinensis]|uniref:Uncharacterized protein n=1 Tax=Populus alba x Populus x berolinensis TaxID=444605 RepID=A0AAD6MJB8_9ROSI|nr:hypothetical protein NC653_019799 [Populus alba x Populus x berolinensis]